MADQAPAAQRRWRAACPNCGAPVEFASAASSSAVCGFCRSTLLRDGDTLSRIGQSAEIFDDYSPLQLGATGRWMGKGFAVVGRVQRGSELGNWNEWHLLFDSGGDVPRTAWLSEDNGQFVLALEAPLAETPPEAPGVGLPLTVAGQRWQVAAVVDAALRAAEGELPRPPRAGRVVELRNAQGEVGTLEYAECGPPLWSVGRAVQLAELALVGLRTTAEGESVAEGRFAGRSIACPNCGSPLAPKLAQTKSMVCGQCKAIVDLPEGEAKALGFVAQSPGMEPLIPLGRTGTLAIDDGQPLPWQVVGYQERCDIPEDADDEQSFWREYLLFNRLAGFAFLVDTRDGWSVVRTLTGAPTPGASATVGWQNRIYAQRWAYMAKTTHVLGEFYWPVRLEDRVHVTDYLTRDGQYLLSRERQGNEVTWSGGRPVPADVVQNAFGLRAPAAQFSRDASAFKNSGATLLRNIVIALFVIVLLFALLRACSSDDCQGYKDSFGENSNEYRQCRASSRGSGVWIGNGGGSYGGYSSGGGGHK